MSELVVTRVGPESAAQVLDIVLTAFSRRPPLDPPADALGETVESVAAKLAGFGGLLATQGGEPVGTLVFDPVGPTMWLRRFAVVPSEQGHGIAHALVDAAVETTYAAAQESGEVFEDLAVVAREELPRNVRFWVRQGFHEIGRTPPSIRMHRPLRTTVVEVPDADAMRALGARMAGRLEAGDLLVLSGQLGAGKTTFTQGLGEGLEVRGPITSPTFVIARVHPSEREGGGPALVHVDAYRLGSVDELDDLDLDTDLDDAVTVVEWGEGKAEGLSDSRLDIRILRALAGEHSAEDDPDALASDERRVEITPIGPRWHGLPFTRLGEQVPAIRLALQGQR